jgi:protease-4
VFRIDSGGGSALASDLIWHATQRARGKKPVIVSMSDVAGSGGYYIAAGANKILAQPTTLTGSIGVVFMRPNVGGLLHRLGIAAETLGRGRYARLNDLTTPLDPGMRTKLLEEVENIYAVFVDRVARGRGLTDERVDELGRGRVWTGAQAREIGLVDETGGFLAAIDAAKTAAGIPASEEVELLHYPRPKPFAERLTEALTARLVTPPRLPAGEEIRAALAVLPFVDGGVLALMPETIRIE